MRPCYAFNLCRVFLVSIGNASKDGLNEFNTNVGDYYDCRNKTTFELSDGTSMDIRDVKIQAFRNKNDTTLYGKSKYIYMYKYSHVIPVKILASIRFSFSFTKSIITFVKYNSK